MILQKHYLLFLFCLFPSLIFGKHLIIETAKTKYLAKIQENKRNHMKEHGTDYVDETGWLDECSLKSATGDTTGNGRGRGETVTKDVKGCSEIELKCDGGCLKIKECKFYCKTQVVSSTRGLRLLQDKCDKKNYCNVSPISETFVFIRCPDEDRRVRIVYRCDGGQDMTLLIQSSSCGGDCAGNNCGTCGDGRTGQMVQKDLKGGNKLTIICEGGCIKIMKVLYSCKIGKSTKDSQLRTVKGLCEDREKCEVSATREMFGYEECPDTKLEEEMNLWVVYKCDGGEDITDCEMCQLEEICGNGKTGQMVQKDLKGGNKLTITCDGGCIKMMKVLYSCKMGESSNASQLILVKGLCEDKDKCEVSATRDMFGSTECPGKKEEEMNLWIVYRCDI